MHMKDLKLKILVILIGVALIGLIYIQYYWIKAAYKIEEQKFDRTVAFVLSDVVERLERAEADSLLKQTLILKTDTKPNKTDSFKNTTKNKLTSIRINTTNSEKALKIGSEKTGYSYIHSFINGNDSTCITVCDTLNPQLKKTIVYNTGFKMDLDTINSDNGIVVIGINKSDSRYDTNNLVFTLNAINKRKDILKRAFQDYIIQTEVIPDKRKISISKIDTLLKKEFSNKGIDIPHLVSLEWKNKDSIHFIQKEKHEKEKNAVYKVSLFPSDLKPNNIQLMVNFPEKQKFILAQMNLMLVFSGIITITIILLFYTSIRMYYNQKKTSEVKNDLLNNISHEFKTPLSTISIACDTIKDYNYELPSEKISRYTGIITDENKRLIKLVDSMLKTALLEKGRIKLEFTKIDIYELLNKSLDKFRGTENLNLDLQIDSSSDIKEITGDITHLSNVFINLVDNAIKYSGENKIIRITIETAKKGLLVSVKDNGIGIKYKHRKKIFDTFYRIPQGNIHNTSGYGIGLSYVKKIIEQHNGKIQVSSKINEGTTFKIYLPYEQNKITVS